MSLGKALRKQAVSSSAGRFNPHLRRYNDVISGVLENARGDIQNIFIFCHTTRQWVPNSLRNLAIYGSSHKGSGDLRNLVIYDF